MKALIVARLSLGLGEACRDGLEPNPPHNGPGKVLYTSIVYAFNNHCVASEASYSFPNCQNLHHHKVLVMFCSMNSTGHWQLWLSTQAQ